MTRKAFGGSVALMLLTAGVIQPLSTAPLASSLTVLASVPMTLSTQAVAVDSVTNRIFVVQDDVSGRPGFEVVAVDGVTHAVLATIQVDGFVDQHGIAADEVARKVYVHNGFGLVVIDADTLAQRPSIGLPFSVLGGVAVDPSTQRVFSGSTIQLIVSDGASGAELDRFFLTAGIRDIEFDPSHNRIYATHSTAGFFSVVDLTARSVSQIPISSTIVDPVTGNPNANIQAAAIDATLGQLYLAQRTLSGPANLFVYDTATLALVQVVPIAARTDGLAVDSSNHLVYAPSGQFPYGVTVVDGVSRSAVAQIPTPRQVPLGAAVNPVTHRSYYPDAIFPPESTLIVVGSPNGAPAADAGPDQSVECAGHDGTSVTLDGSASSDPDNDALSYEWRDAAGGIVGAGAQLSLTLPVGEHTFTLFVIDDDGAAASDTMTVTVRDTTPPVITSVSATPSMLWPPDGRMSPVTVGVSLSDACDATATCRIVEVRSSEVPLARGSGQRSPDWEITGELTVGLRAERSGHGSGRTYTIAIECRDASGNSTHGTVDVLVPHDRRTR